MNQLSFWPEPEQLFFPEWGDANEAESVNRSKAPKGSDLVAFASESLMDSVSLADRGLCVSSGEVARSRTPPTFTGVVGNVPARHTAMSLKIPTLASVDQPGARSERDGCRGETTTPVQIYSSSRRSEASDASTGIVTSIRAGVADIRESADTLPICREIGRLDDLAGEGRRGASAVLKTRPGYFYSRRAA